MLNVGSFYDRKADELNTPDLMYMISQSAWRDDMYDYVSNHDKVSAAEVRDALYGDISYTLDGDTVREQFYFRSTANLPTMNIVNITDALTTKPENALILPLIFRFNNVRAGDSFTIRTTLNSYDFIIYGFFEDAMFGASLAGLNMAYVSQNMYDKLEADVSLTLHRTLSMQLHDPSGGNIWNFISQDLRNFFNFQSGQAFWVTREGGRSTATMFPTIMSLVLILVALITLAIAMIVVNFTIVNSIGEDIKTLGALKSIGFTSKQIILSLLIQFLIIVFAGGLVGALLSFSLAGVIGNVISSTSGLLFGGVAPFILPAVIAVFAVAGISTLIIWLVARKARTVTPINALRQGLSHHSFKKNVAPFDKTKLNLNLNMAIKQFVNNIKNNAVVFVVVFLFSLLTVITATLYHNFVQDTTAFKQMLGAEPAEILVTALSEEFATTKFDEIANRPNVVNTVRRDAFAATVGDNWDLHLDVWSNIQERESNVILDGRYPMQANDIVISAALRNAMGLRVGDMIEIEFNDNKKSFLITGITNIGFLNAEINLSGFLELHPDAVLKNMYLFLTDDSPEFIAEFIAALITDYGREIHVQNFSEAMDAMLGGIEGPVAIATYLIIVITIFTVCFVFFLMIFTIIRRRKKEFGTLKAIGFTSNQLMVQMLLSFLPAIILGIVLGIGLGFLVTNPILSLMFMMLGIVRASFAIPTALTLISGTILVVVCVLSVFLVSLKLKGIAPQKLITE